MLLRLLQLLACGLQIAEFRRERYLMDGAQISCMQYP